MAKILFIDTADRVVDQWKRSGCQREHEMVAFEPFRSMERTSELVALHQPDAIIVAEFVATRGVDRLVVTGAQVVQHLRAKGLKFWAVVNEETVRSFIDAGVVVNCKTDRTPHGLKKALDLLFLPPPKSPPMHEVRRSEGTPLERPEEYRPLWEKF